MSLLLTSSAYPPPSSTSVYPLSLHDALPISLERQNEATSIPVAADAFSELTLAIPIGAVPSPVLPTGIARVNSEKASRSEEHTFELQSHSDLVCRLLLENKN